MLRSLAMATTKRTMTATLPDGTKVKRGTAKPYTHVIAVAKAPEGPWKAWGWTSKGVVHDAARIAQCKFTHVRLVPVDPEEVY